MRPVVKRRNGITKGKPDGGMMKLIRLLLKKDCWKAWKQGGGKEQYLQAKRNAKRTGYTAKKTAEEKKFSDLKSGMDDIFKIAKQLRKDNQNVVDDNCDKDDSGNLSFDNEAQKVAWKQHYKRLLNEEFSWNP